ncbi:MAG TPA: glutathionylspermidine synthase family protein [Verrucomicrobiae bacterium]
MIAHPMCATDCLPESNFRDLRLRTIFDCFKWDPQVQDSSVLAPFAITIPEKAWRELASMAERLAAETIAGEDRILSNTTLLSSLKLPRKLEKAIRCSTKIAAVPRVMRFDFHWTTEGWRISEVNSDVPGGFIEAQGFTGLVAEVFGLRTTGFPATAVARALIATADSAEPHVGFVHASAYTDDRQVMLFLARELEKLGGHAVLLDPSQIDWRREAAVARCSWFQGKLDALFRFFPAEWLPNLRRTCGWENYFANSHVQQCNPATALISQSKRFGILCPELRTLLPTWNSLLPPTHAVRKIDPRSADWVFKPALGRVGDGIGIAGITREKELREIHRSMSFFASEWVAQQRFQMIPVETPLGPQHVCLGVYTVNGLAAGIYGRCSASPIINHTARDVAVLLAADPQEVL